MNEANWDRIGRAVIGVVLLVLAVTAFGGVVAIVAGIVGAILLVTGVVGWCPIYASLKIGTRAAPDA